MDSGCSWEQTTCTLINELIQGMELTNQLKFHMGSSPSPPPSSPETQDLLLQRIIYSFDNALMILRRSGQEVPPQHLPTPTGLLPESSISADGSPPNEDSGFKDQQENRDVSKKRKMLPTWTDQVKISPENGLEGPIDDGFNWRKYGQKDILGAIYPRSYYRCTYKGTQNCCATKQVQRSDEDPTVFEITYKGKHTCNQVNNHSAPPSISSEKQELNHNKQQLQGQQIEMLMNLRANLRVNTENFDTKDEAFCFNSRLASMKGANQLLQKPTDNHLDIYSPSFLSPTTSELNNFSPSPFQLNGFGGTQNFQHSESDLTEIISANTSATNSPIMDWDFSIYPVNLDQNFPFDIQGFFT